MSSVDIASITDNLDFMYLDDLPDAKRFKDGSVSATESGFSQSDGDGGETDDGEADRADTNVLESAVKIEDLPPVYLSMSTEEYYASTLEQRNLVKQLMKGVDTLFAKQIVQDLYRSIPESCVLWVGGGRSWKAMLDKFYPSVSSKKELEGIVYNGNWDMFLVAPDEIVREQLSIEFYKILKRYVKEYNKSSKYGTLEVTNSSVKSTFNGGYKVKPSHTCTIFDGSQMTLQLTTSISRRQKGGAENMKLDVMYLELGAVLNLDTAKFRQNFLFNSPGPAGSWYLNDNGVAIFKRYITSARKMKGLNVDFLRTKIITDIRAEQKDKMHPTDLAKLYIDTFRTTGHYNEYLYKNLTVEGINEDSYRGTLVDRIEEGLMRVMRDDINTIVKTIDDEISQDNPGSFIFIVGGDAMRRYKRDTATKDIDSKLYCTVCRNVGKFVSETIIKACIAMDKLLLEYVSTEPQELPTSGKSKVSILRNTSKIRPNVPHFRLRYLPAGDVIPFDLYSLDYLYSLQVQETGMLTSMTLPALDIIVQPQPKKTKRKRDGSMVYPSYTPYSKKNSEVKYATLDFLINDLRSTFEDKTKADGRFWSNKIEKDRRRYETLIGLRGRSYNPDKALGKTNTVLVRKMESSEIESLVESYTSVFTSEKKKGEKKVIPKVVYETDDKGVERLVKST